MKWIVCAGLLAAFLRPKVSVNQGTSDDDAATVVHIVAARYRVEVWLCRL